MKSQHRDALPVASLLSHRVAKARRTKLESRCEKRREAYIECVARESPRLDPYPKVKRFSYDVQNLFVDVLYLVSDVPCRPDV
jgi:hypothetical protein